MHLFIDAMKQRGGTLLHLSTSALRPLQPEHSPPFEDSGTKECRVCRSLSTASLCSQRK